MSEHQETSSIQHQSDEKVSSVMVYTSSALYWGEIITKESIRVSVWLRTNAAPDTLRMLKAQMVLLTGSVPKPMSFAEIYIPVSEVNAYHLIPPAQDPLDYDPNEPMRYMDPVTVMVGPFRMDGEIRLSTMANLAKFIELAKESYSSLYNVDITNLLMPNQGTLHVPHLLVRQKAVFFAKR